jgi:hypothetical protein
MHPISMTSPSRSTVSYAGPAGTSLGSRRTAQLFSARLENYAFAIMGRATYEFGYRFGMPPGQNPYPQMNIWGGRSGTEHVHLEKIARHLSKPVPV